MIKTPIYFDNNATTPVNENVLQAMLPYFSHNFGNASSNTHAFGWVAMEAVKEARNQVATFIGASPDEITFTSGATEAINMALCGAFDVYAAKGNHIITVQTEHKAVLDTLSYLEKKGAVVTRLPVSRDGLIDLEMLEKSINPKTILIAVMYANNETGVLQPISDIGKMAHQREVLFLCDATQAAGKVLFNVDDINADLLCLSAHKYYGPKGAGALYIRRKNPKVKITPYIYGGGHENGLRSGTLNVPAIVGFGKSSELAGNNWWDYAFHTSNLRTRLEQNLLELGDVFCNGTSKNRLPNTSNLTIKGVKSGQLISALPFIAFSTGSACSSANPEPSHVLLAMGLSKEEANCSVRFSLGINNTAEEINFALDKIKEAVGRLRK